MIPKPDHKMKRALKKAARLAEDRRWSANVKARALLRCEYPGCKAVLKGLAAHHVITRSNKAVRHYLPNGICLCNGHHFNWHIRPIEYLEKFIAIRGQAWYDDLRAKANERHVKHGL